MKILIFFQNLNIRIRTKNTRTRPEVHKYPNGFYTSIPKYPKIRNTRSEPERVPERPPLLYLNTYVRLNNELRTGQTIEQSFSGLFHFYWLHFLCHKIQTMTHFLSCIDTCVWLSLIPRQFYIKFIIA